MRQIGYLALWFFLLVPAGTAEEKVYDLELKITTEKEVAVKIPVKDGKAIGSRTEKGRWVYEPIAIVPIQVTVKNVGKREAAISPFHYTFTLRDPRGTVIPEGGNYEWKESKDERWKKTDLIKPGESHTHKLTLLVTNFTPEDGQGYTLECKLLTRSKTSFVARVVREKGEPPHSFFFDSIVRLVGGEDEACGVIFRYDPGSKEAFVLTAGRFIEDKKAFKAHILHRDGKRLEKPELYDASVVFNVGGEFAVLKFKMPKRPRFFALAPRDYDFSKRVDFVSCRWNKTEGTTARLVVPRGFTGEGTLSVYYAEPENGHAGAGMFDRSGRLVAVGWGGSTFAHTNRLALFLTPSRVHEFFEKNRFKLPPPGYIGITISSPKKGPGVRIEAVEPGLPAEKAGLKTNDVVLSLDGLAVYDASQLINLISGSEEGTEILLEVRREAKTFAVKMIAGSRPSEPKEKNERGNKSRRVGVVRSCDSWSG